MSDLIEIFLFFALWVCVVAVMATVGLVWLLVVSIQAVAYLVAKRTGRDKELVATGPDPVAARIATLPRTAQNRFTVGRP